MNKDKLSELLREHRQYLYGLPEGNRADLRNADLQNADLRGADLQNADLRYADLWRADLWRADLRYADLRGADIDYSCWPLWCGSFDAKVVSQLFCNTGIYFYIKRPTP